MSFLYSVQTSLPQNRYTQEQITAEFLKRTCNPTVNPKLVERFHRSVQVGSRYLALPLETYAQITNFTESNRLFFEVALALAETCVRNLFTKSHFKPMEINQIIFTTVTGLSVPSLDAHLVNKIGFSDCVKRVPLFGLGCLAGAAGLSRAHDYLVGHPNEAVLLLALELCSLTVQKEDLSLANLVASGLFGDGAAAQLLVGDQKNSTGHPVHPKGKIIATQSAFFKNTEKVMGWDI